MYADVGLLILRLIVGLLLFGHGAQKLFGWFGGPGVKGFSGWLGSMGLRPAPFWAYTAGACETFGGLLLALGLFDPFGSLGIIAAMLTAIALVHWGKGIWASKGGSELPLTNIAAAFAIALTGPGAYSLDRLFNIVLPEPISLRAGGLVLIILGLVALFLTKTRPKAA